MTDSAPAESSPRDRKWAPWWVYVVIILPLNNLRQFVIDMDQFSGPLTFGIAIGQALILATVITVIYRLIRR